MELPLTLSLLAILLSIIAIKRHLSRRRDAPKLPPGPRPLPLIGSIHRLLGAPPHIALRALSARHGPLMHLRLGQLPFLVVSSAEAAEAVMRTHDHCFAARPETAVSRVVLYNNASMAFAPCDARWRQNRRLVALELLSTRRVRASHTPRQEEVVTLVAQIAAVASSTAAAVNVTEALYSLSSSMTSRVAFGRTCEHRMRFVEAVKEMMVAMSAFNVVDLFPSLWMLDVVTGMASKLDRIRQTFDEILGEIIREHEEKAAERKISDEEEEEEDFVDVLLRLKRSGDLEVPLTDVNVKSLILDVFIGGTDTTAIVLEWAMSELMKNPNVMEKAQAEVRQVLAGKAAAGKLEESDFSNLPYLMLVIKETLRLHQPLPFLVPRVCKESCNVLGYDVPAGTIVFINAWAIMRDPERWNDAESFKPERFNGSRLDFKGGSFEYLPFGSGRRICPGMVFGMAMVVQVLAQLLFYFDWSLPAGVKAEELDMSEEFSGTMGRKSPLSLHAIPRIPLPCTVG